ncbi:MAG TPA: FGGY family carbohydrate kinase [Thermomicrobiales bacterium]|nr:FGGY family carbohydrate kinase [Thermomicrobiales bacterium]
MTLLVGLDVGTTGVKAVVYEPDGRALAIATTPTPTTYPQPGRAFYTAEGLWESVVTVLRQALAQIDEPARIAGVAVASMGEAGVPLDRHGEPTAEIIAWFDNRTRPQAEWLDRVIGRDRLFASSGLSLQPIFSLNKMLWLKDNEPAAWGRTTRWLHVADYIAFRLSGVAATDRSLASRTLAFDLHRLEWDDAIVREAGIDPVILAPIVSGGAPLGHVTRAASEATGLPASAIVAAGGHDHVCGALAAGAIAPGVMLNSLGTAEAVFLPLDKPLSNPAVGRQGFTQGAHAVGGRTYVFAGQYTSGASVTWIRDAVGPVAGPPPSYDELMADAAATPPGSLGVVFLPHLRLANPPHDDPRSRGAFVGLSTDVRRGALTRAVLEGIALESRNSLEDLLTYPGVVPPREILAIGGGSRNDLLMRIKASVMNRTHLVLGAEEATALGAAILGGLGAGVFPNVEAALAGLRYARTPVAPNPADAAFYDALFTRVYRRLYPAIAPISHAIVDLQSERA